MIKQSLHAMLVLLLLSLIFPVSSALAQTPVTRQQICEIIVQRMEQAGTITHFYLEDMPFPDTQNEAVNICYTLGIVKGDAAGNYNPQQLVTKEQAAVIFKRTQDYIIPRLIYDTAKIKQIPDCDTIAPYARSSVMLLTATGTIDGGTFVPTADIDASYVHMIMDRIYQNTWMPVSRPGNVSSRNVPVLMYHKIDNPPSENSANAYLFVRPGDFEAQIRYLAENGYTFLYPDELYYADYCAKPVVITFDDGYLDNYVTAFEILKKYNAKATIFVACSNIDQPDMMTKEQIRTLSDSGLINIGSHSKTHRDLTSLSSADLTEEMAGSQWLLEQITGRRITNMAYPFGFYNNTVKQEASRFFASCFSVIKGSRYDPLAIPRFTVDRNMSLNRFILYVSR